MVLQLCGVVSRYHRRARCARGAEADVAEADIGLVRVAQDMEFTVDAFPGQTFLGKVTQVRNAPKI